MNIVIYGCGENGCQAYHCLRHDSNVTMIGFLDGNPKTKGTEYLGLPVLGDFDEIARLRRDAGLRGAIAAVGDNVARARINTRLRHEGLQIVRAIHPQVMIESPKSIGEGVILEMGAAVHALAEVGEGCFMGTATIMAHHCKAGRYTTLSGGVSTGGGVTVGSFTLIGVGANIHPHRNVGSNVIVGVGASVIKDVPDNCVVAGVPARHLRTLAALDLTGVK
ncbi:MAG: NeuD/PglB/VioB family sugar acetyltransferase [Cyanobacteria bacterium]|nr:NeuD/PglB/VioB family sugar acetyltransferase [Cyanobacteriota bacterium]